MTMQEQLRDAEIEVARLERHSNFLKDRARRIKEHLISQPTGDPPLIQAIADHLAESGEFQAVAIDRQVEMIRLKIREATSSVIIPTAGGMQ